jgi:hypothetical protein
VPARSKAWTVFVRSNIGIVGSNPARGIDVRICVFCVCLALCVGSGLTSGWSPVKGVLPNEYRIKKLKTGQGPNGCTTIERGGRSYTHSWSLNCSVSIQSDCGPESGSLIPGSGKIFSYAPQRQNRLWIDPGTRNSCCPSPAQSDLVSGPIKTYDNIFVLSKTFVCFEMGSPLRPSKRGRVHITGHFPSTGGWLGATRVSPNHTLPISPHYSTHEVHKSHVKLSEANFLYSTTLLKPNAYCYPLVWVLLPLLFTRNS